MDFPGRLIAAILAALLVAIFPLQYIAGTAEENIDAHIAEHTENLSDTIRNKGYLDVSDYENFINILDSSGELYDVELEDIHPIMGEEIAHNHGREGFTPTSFKASKDEFLSLNKEKVVNGMRLVSSQEEEIHSLATHIHTDDCYEGHRHVDPLSGVNLSNAPVRIQFESGKTYYYNGTYYPSDMRVSFKCGQCYSEIYVFSIYRGPTAVTADVYTIDNGVFSFIRVPHGGVDSYGKPSFYASNIYRQFESYRWTATSIPDGSYDQSGTSYTSGVFNFNLAGLPKWDSNANISYKPFTGCPRARNYGHNMKANACHLVGYKGKVKISGITYYSDNTSNLNLGVTCNTCKKEILNLNLRLYSAGGSSSGLTSASAYATFPVKNSSGVIEQISIGSNMSAHLGSSDRDWDNLRTYSNILDPAYWQLRSQLAPYTTFNDYGNGFFNAESIDFPLTGIPIKCGQYASSPLLWLPNMGCAYCGTYGSNYSCGLPQDTTYDCNKVVTSIIPTHPTQTVKKGESIITTATATYLDDHTGIVNCASNFNTNLPGDQTVTLTYSGLVGNARTTGTRTCTLRVTVIDKVLQYITAEPSSQIIPRLGTPSFTVKAFYSDGSSAVLGTGKYSVSAFNNGIGGQNTLTISYSEGGLTKTTMVTVYVDNLVSITAVPEAVTVDKYTQILPFSINASYLYTGIKTVLNGFSISGYNPAVLGDQTVTVSYTDQGTTVTTTLHVHVTPIHKVCPRCENSYEMNPDDTDPGCPFCRELVTGIIVSPEELEVIQGEGLPITVRAIYRDGTTREVSGWTSSYDPDKIGLQPVTVEYGGYATLIYIWVKEAEVVCPICGTHYPSSESRCPVCSEYVTGIYVVPEEITVNQYEDITLQVVATFRDGVTAPVTDWSIDKTTSAAGVFTATVSYRGFTAQVKLTVLSSSRVTCPICGLVYDVGEYPNGCPTCSEVITGIEAYLTSGSRLVQYGSIPRISVVLVFLDTHREIVESGYITEGFDPFRMGEQTILVRYLEFSCTLEVDVVDALETVICPNGHVYYLNEDGTDPGCPFCAIGESHGVVIFYDITYLPEILEKLYTDGVYYFDKSNFLTVRVTKRNVSLAAKIQKESIFAKMMMSGKRKRFVYGGEV